MLVQRQSLLIVLWSVLTLPTFAQIPAAQLVTQSINQSHLTTLHGSMHPLARAGKDLGPVDESAPAERLLIILNRPPEREAAFQQALKDMHTPGSPNYHHWLTPEQIGERFGAADTDIAAVSNWLNSTGLRVSHVSKSMRFVEFSGTVGQANAAFHTQIHEYMVNGNVHHANATEIKIPQALAGLVAGVSGLDDFRPKPLISVTGQAHYDAAARKIIPDYNLPSGSKPLLFGVVPADFATQYDLTPLFNANVTGAGKTIGIIDVSNIDLSQAAAYRRLFGLAANPVQVILDGGDPGPNSAQIETYLDVEVAGAAAPGATVNLYLSAGSTLQDPLQLAALRAVDDNQADVLSLSYGQGEAELGIVGNQFWNALWEQAAAQGQTVMVSAGDTGQIPDQNYLYLSSLAGPAVSGMASTPWNVAVGGTDFYYSDYATGAPSASTFWNVTNDPTTKGSLKAPLTEQVWNDPFGLDAIPNGMNYGEVYAGGGGASSCSAMTSTNTCIGGYTKPAWQTGPGVPADGVRDLPDVSLFASDGANYSGWVICSFEGACTPDSTGNFDVQIVGGTSASAPAMAGIMALINQKYGRQGQANTTLYALAQQKPAVLHDITLGGNWDLCYTSDANCPLPLLFTDIAESKVYAAAPGYDQASGLGSVDATQMVNNWNSITFQPTSTSLQLTPANITHGSNVILTTSVTAVSGSGTPTGAVAILTNSTLPSSTGQTAISLSGGNGSATLNNLPGGSYDLTAQYSGDGQFAGSVSQPQTLTVSAEASVLNLTIPGLGGNNPYPLAYGVPVIFTAQPIGINAAKGSTDGSATGNVTFTLDGATAVSPLNVGGVASWETPALSVGIHSAGASYAGDSSFLASSAATQTFSVIQGSPYISINLSSGFGGIIYAGSSATVSVEMGPLFSAAFTGQSASLGLAAPTGTVTTKLVLENSDLIGIGCAADTTGYAQTATLASPLGLYAQTASVQAIFSNLAAGDYMLCAQYSGDTNWQASGEIILNTISVSPPTTPPAATTTTSLNITPASISDNETATLTATVTGAAGSTVAPTGYISFFDNSVSTPWFWLNQLVPSLSGASATFTYSLPPDAFWSNGSNQITAVYSGDNRYLPSTSAAASVNVTQGGSDFIMQPQVPQLNVASGSTGSVSINMASLYSFNGTVALTCTPSSSQFSCSMSPASVALNGTATTTVNVTATIPSGSASMGHGSKRGKWFGAGATLALCLLFFVPTRRLKWNGIAFVMVLLAATFVTACGGSGGGTRGGGTGGTGGGSTPPAPTTATPANSVYSVLVTGTANGIAHNVKIILLVH